MIILTADINESFCYSRFPSENGMHFMNIFFIEKGSLLTAVARFYSISII